MITKILFGLIGIWLLIASVNLIQHTKKYRSKEKTLQPIALIGGASITNIKGTTKIIEPISTISIHQSDAAVVVVGDNENVLEESKNCWDPLEPAYDRHGNRKNGEKKVIWSDNILKM